MKPCEKKVPVIVIFAPTASGKTALTKDLFGRSSLALFKEGGEVISADSQAVYRYMNIGTAKPDPQEQQEVPHHLIDFIEPTVQFDTAMFVEKADFLCRKIYAEGKIPLVTGGTGFYIRNFILGLPKAPQSDEKIRENLKRRMELEGNKELYAELKRVDRDYAKKINIHDNYRIVRALEVFYATGKPLSSFELPSEPRSQYDFCTIVLNRCRDELYERIDRRVDMMFENGLPEEIRMLKNMGFTADTPGMKAIGYREFFSGDEDLEVIKYNIKNNSHHYAKKQYTYMKGIPGAHFIDYSDSEQVKSVVKEFVRNLRKF